MAVELAFEADLSRPLFGHEGAFLWRELFLTTGKFAYPTAEPVTLPACADARLAVSVRTATRRDRSSAARTYPSVNALSVHDWARGQPSAYVRLPSRAISVRLSAATRDRDVFIVFDLLYHSPSPFWRAFATGGEVLGCEPKVPIALLGIDALRCGAARFSRPL